MYAKNSTDVLRYPINSTEALRYTFMYRTSHTIRNTCSVIHTYCDTYATFIANEHFCYAISCAGQYMHALCTRIATRVLHLLQAGTIATQLLRRTTIALHAYANRNYCYTIFALYNPISCMPCDHMHGREPRIPASWPIK